MKKFTVYLIIVSLQIQIGCSSITQIPFPVEQSQSENEIRSLNYFGERLSSTLYLSDSVEVEAYWLKLKDDKIYFLTEGLDDTTSIGIDKIQSIKFYDWWRSCLYGGLSGVVLYTWIGMATWNLYAALSGFSLGMAYGFYAVGEREFNFVHK